MLSAPETPKKKKKIGRKSKLQKLPTGVTTEVLKSIDAELEEAYKQRQESKNKTKSFIKKLMLDNDESFSLTLGSLGSYLAQSEPEYSLSPEFENIKPPKSNKNKNIDYNVEAMEAVEAMLAPYQKGLNIINQSTKYQLKTKSKGIKTAKDRNSKRNENNKKKKLIVNDDMKPKKTKKAIEKEQKEKFINLLKAKAESAKKRKREELRKLNHNMIDIGDINHDNDGDKFELVYVPTTQIETQFPDDVNSDNLIALNDSVQSNNNNAMSLNFDVFDKL